MKKGYTLLEMVVAMGIFSVFSALAIGAFVMILNLKTLTGNLRDSNQKLRIATEYISRYGRRAEKIDTESCNGECQSVIISVNPSSPTPFSIRFSIHDGKLFKQECESASCNWDPDTGIPEVNMLSGKTNLVAGSFFKVTRGRIPQLQVALDSEINDVRDSAFFDDKFKLDIVVPLEGLK